MTHDNDGAPVRRRRFGAPKNWREQFLACLAETSNVTAAAQCADISLSWVYKTKREDRGFAQAWPGLPAASSAGARRSSGTQLRPNSLPSSCQSRISMTCHWPGPTSRA